MLDGSILLSCLVKSSIWVRVSPQMLCPLACYRSGAAGSVYLVAAICSLVCFLKLAGMLCFLKLAGQMVC